MVDRGMRLDLLENARLLARTVNLQQVESLSGSETDLSNPKYASLKQHLIEVRSANPKYRFLYLMGRKANHQIFFFVDSEKVGTKDYSPPGQIYDESSEDLGRIFESKTDFIEGPITDRWGEWVSALVPVTNPETDAVIAAFGMDIDAHSWRRQVATRTALPVVFLFMILTGMGAVIVTARRVGSSPEPVFKRLMPPLMIMMILTFVGVMALMWQQYRQLLTTASINHNKEVTVSLQMLLDQQTIGLAEVVQVIAADTSVQQALRNADTHNIFVRYRPVYDSLLRLNHLTHFNILNRNRVCILRVNQPVKHGDLISGLRLLESERTGNIASGLDVGPTGIPTLQVTQPIFSEGKLTGYVEIGKNIDDILMMLHAQYGDHIAVITSKVKLNRDRWEEVRRLLGLNADWDRLPQVVVNYASQGYLPEAFASWANQVIGNSELGAKDRDVDFNGKYWKVSVISLPKVSGKGDSDLLLMNDISSSKAVIMKYMAWRLTTLVLLLTLLSFVLYALIRHTDASILSHQRELRESEERYRSILNASPDGITITDLDGRMLMVSQTAMTMFRFDQQEKVLGRLVTDFVVTEDRERALSNITSLFEDTKTDPPEYRGQRADGSVVDIEVNNEIIRGADGQPTHIISAIRDITRRKQAENDIRQAYTRESVINEILRLILVDMPLDKLVSTALDLVLDTADLGLEPIGAVFLVEDDPDALMLKAQRGLADPLCMACACIPFGKCLCGRVAESGKVEFADTIDDRHDIKYEGMKPHGHYCVPLRMNNQTIGVLCTYTKAGHVHSIKLEQFLLGVANALASVITRKHAEDEQAKLQAQLQQAQKMESVGRLAGGVAHDFNNMLGVILGNTQMALENLDPECSLYDDLTEVRVAAERSADLTRQLLAFARKQTIILKVIDLNKIIEGMLKMLQRMIGENIQLNWQPMTSLWNVKMDPSQIDQMLANLCINARDAIKDHGTITVETGNTAFDESYCSDHPLYMPGEFVRLAVNDDGCGMNEMMLSQIFEPFFTTKGVGEGTGLGLATVYGAVKQNNGFIIASSELGKGTTVTIYLPRYLSSADNTQVDSAATPILGGLETILVVEDEPTVLRMTCLMLQRAGYTVIPAASPSEAIHLADEYSGKIHMVLTDVMMPEMNGKDVVKELMSRYPGIKRLYMSGYTSDIIADQGKLDDGEYFIQKPFTNRDLFAKVRQALAE
ncbi:MAG: PAS domain S-box protein [Armatimonadota bacterium]